MEHYTWKEINEKDSEEIKSHLIGKGGKEKETPGEYEEWRIRFSDSTFTFYSSGKLHSSPSDSNDPAVVEAREEISSIVGHSFEQTSKKFVIGLDETGKGELAGHIILTGVFYPQSISEKLDRAVGTADTKDRHDLNYWDKIYQNIDQFKRTKLHHITEKIPPWEVDKYNINKIMDVTYQRILNSFLRRVDIDDCRIVLDDYGIGDTLKRFLRFLENQGAEVVVEETSEDRYLEARVASLIAKRVREAVMKSINVNDKFIIDGCSVGSGNAGDEQTIEWLKKWHDSGKRWPWFIKRSFRPVRKIEGKAGRASKRTPPIKEELLSDEFRDDFNKGKISIQSLSLVCPHCGNVSKNYRFANFKRDGRQISRMKCTNSDCKEFIKDAGMTLRYYCGYAIPDSNAIQSRILSNDLEASRFFDNFTVVLPPAVRKECDGTPAGKKEFEKFREFNSKNRINLETPGSVEEIPNNLSTEAMDERIIDSCLNHNAMLLSNDKSCSTFAVANDVFTISISL